MKWFDDLFIVYSFIVYPLGVTQFRNGDIVGAGHSFGMILDAIEEDSSFVSPEVAHVLNAIGSIHFSNKMYDKA